MPRAPRGHLSQGPLCRQPQLRASATLGHSRSTSGSMKAIACIFIALMIAVNHVSCIYHALVQQDSLTIMVTMPWCTSTYHLSSLQQLLVTLTSYSNLHACMQNLRRSFMISILFQSTGLLCLKRLESPEPPEQDFGAHKSSADHDEKDPCPDLVVRTWLAMHMEVHGISMD